MALAQTSRDRSWSGRDRVDYGTSSSRPRAKVAGVLPIRKPRSLRVHDGDVVLAAGGVGRADEFPDNLEWMTSKIVHDLNEDRRGHGIGQPVTAEKQRRILLERPAKHLDEVRVVGIVRLRSDIAIDLVAAGMLHRLPLAQLAGILSLTDRRMIAGQLLDSSGP